MQVSELIALAKIRSGKSQKAMAEEMGHGHPKRISKLSTGELIANASEIIYLAEAAHMPPIKVLAEIEAERHPDLAHVWKKVTDSLTSLKQALGLNDLFPAATTFSPVY